MPATQAGRREQEMSMAQAHGYSWAGILRLLCKKELMTLAT